MRFNDMYPSKYLKKEDVTTPIRTTIRSVSIEELDGDSGKESKPVIFFTSAKEMVLNKGNGTILYETYGEPDQWQGKPVEIYVDPNVMFGSKRIGGLRLRIPSGPAFTSGWTWAQAIAEAAKVGITKDTLVAALKAKGCAGYNPERDTPVILELIGAASKTEQGFDDGIPEFGDAYEGQG